MVKRLRPTEKLNSVQVERGFALQVGSLAILAVGGCSPELPGEPLVWHRGRHGAGAASPRLGATKIATGCHGSCLQSARALEAGHMKRILSNYKE